MTILQAKAANKTGQVVADFQQKPKSSKRILPQRHALPTTRRKKNPRRNHCLTAIDRLLARALAKACFDLPYATEIAAARRLAILCEGGGA